MRFLSIVTIVGMLPLAGCAAIQGMGFGGPGDIEDLPQSYNIFFGIDSAALDDVAQGIIAQVAADAMEHEPDSIVIAGFAGPGQGESAANIADERAAAVENALASHGVEPELFTRGTLAVDPSLPDLATRRVEIRFEF